MKIDAGADLGILQILKSVSYTTAEAIAEFVDNSVQSYIDNKDDLLKINKNYKLEVEIVCTPTTITIRDNAAGIEDKVFQLALKTAAITNDLKVRSKKKSKKSLNEFGMGMKAAAYWFTNTWSITTKSIYEKKNKTVNIDLEKLIKNGSGEINSKDYEENSKKGYTIITLKNLHQHISSHKTITSRLGSIHRKFLNKDINIFYTGGKDKKFQKFKITYEQPKLRIEPPTAPYENWINEHKSNLKSARAKKLRPSEIKWKIPTNFEFGVIKKGLKASGYVAKMDSQARDVGGIYYFRNKKLLEGPVFPEELGFQVGSSSYNAIYGEIEFDGPESVFTKNALNIDDRDREDFGIKLKHILREDYEKSGSSLLKQLRIANVKINDLYDQEKKLLQGKINADDLEDYRHSQKHHGIDVANKALMKNKNTKDLSKDPKKPLPNFDGKVTPVDLAKDIKIGNKKYTFKLQQTYEEKASDPWLDYGIDEKNKIITIRISMAHPFITNYFLGNSREKIQQGIKLFAQYLIISENTAREVHGVKRPQVIRENINKILFELPPLEGKKVVK